MLPFEHDMLDNPEKLATFNVLSLHNRMAIADKWLMYAWNVEHNEGKVKRITELLLTLELEQNGVPPETLPFDTIEDRR